MKEKICPKCNGKGKIPDLAFVGTRMRKIRERSRISVRSLATQMGISRTHLSDLETCKRNWTDKLTADFHAGIEQIKQTKTKS